jgi:integrase
MVHRGDTPKTTEDSKVRFLARLHQRGGVYYFRAKIPQDLLRHYSPRSEIKFSLKTSSRREAIQRVHEESLRLDNEFKALRKPQSRTESPERLVRRVRHLDDEFIANLCARYLIQQLDDDDTLRSCMVVDEEVWDAHHEQLPVDEAHYRQALKLGKWQEAKPLLDWFLSSEGIALECDDEAYRRLAYSFLKVIVRSIEAIKAKNQGEVVNVQDVVPNVASASLKAMQGPSLNDLFNDWRDAQERPDKTVTEAGSIVKQFLALGDGRSLSELTKPDFVAYRDHLTKVKGLHHKTVEKKLSILSAILQKACDDGKVEVNHCARIRVDKPRVDSPARQPFSRADLKHIFSCPLYAGGVIPKGGKGESAQWLPLLALYTGARLEELAQLEIANVIKDAEVGHFLSITDEGAGQSLKTSSSRRRVPLHPDLVKAGFLKLIEARIKAKESLLFPTLLADTHGKKSGSWSKWWSRYMDNIIKINDPAKVFHSFRHSFKAIAREAEIPEDIHDAISGHVGGGEGRKYGGDYPLMPLLKALKRMKFLGAEVPILI